MFKVNNKDARTTSKPVSEIFFNKVLGWRPQLDKKKTPAEVLALL